MRPRWIQLRIVRVAATSSGTVYRRSEGPILTFYGVKFGFLKLLKGRYLCKKAFQKSFIRLRSAQLCIQKAFVEPICLPFASGSDWMGAPDVPRPSESEWKL